MALRYLKERYRTTVERLDTVLNSTYDGIVAIDADGRVTMFNAASERLLGHSAKAVLGRHVNEVVPGTTLCQVLEDGRPQLGVIVEVNGNTLLTNRTPVKSSGAVIGAVAVFEDITGIKELHKTLEDTRTSVEVLETILNSTYDGLVLVDRKGIITKINRAYLDFLGLREEEAVGKHVTEVIENTRMHIVVETGKAEIGQLQKIHGNEMVVMRLPIFKNGEVVAAVGKVMFRDLRELKALAENLNLIENELKYYKTELHRLKGAKYTFENIIGDSGKITTAKQLARQAAASDSTVLIYGESGTGKEIFAHAIHNYSYRHFGPFVRVNCGAIPGTLFESELFGYERGAFTGAQKGGKPGKFELANNGTIFLDEIGEMPLDMQVKLLRVLQEKEIERVGGIKLLPLDVRVIAASNQPLEELVREKKFREDLFYRLNIFRIELPPLRDIPEDIPLIARHLVDELNEALGTAVNGMSDEAMYIFQRYSWPGNIRELRNVLERTVIVNRHGEIRKNHLPLYLLQNELELNEDLLKFKEEFPGKLEQVMQEAEKALILKALEMTNNNKRQAAQLLGIHRSALYQKLKKYQP
ncbi:MAG: sigma-54-dependent Fis family transcriptional regulator [Firmicutes bacterium]|nr:sigma-54-dependent Fis family transcriptional regulator [Bacillota bacterium]